MLVSGELKPDDFHAVLNGSKTLKDVGIELIRVCPKGSTPGCDHISRGGSPGLRDGLLAELFVSASTNRCTREARQSEAGRLVVELKRRAGKTDSLLGRLNLGSVVHRQRESENGAARLMRVRPQSSTVGIDDGAADRQANPHATRLGGEEGFENPFAILRGDTRSRIADGHDQTLPRARFCADQQFPRFIIGADHGLDRVEDQIQQDLLQLNSISANWRQPFSSCAWTDTRFFDNSPRTSAITSSMASFRSTASLRGGTFLT